MKIKFTKVTCLTCGKTNSTSRSLSGNLESNLNGWYKLERQQHGVMSVGGSQIREWWSCSSAGCLRSLPGIITGTLPNDSSMRDTQRQEHEGRMCDQCGREVTVDILNIPWGGRSPFRKWVKIDEWDACGGKCAGKILARVKRGSMQAREVECPGIAINFKSIRLVEAAGLEELLKK